MIPGRGAIDFPAVLREIAASGYAGWVTVELYPYIDNPDQAGREAKGFIERCGRVYMQDARWRRPVW